MISLAMIEDRASLIEAEHTGTECDHYEFVAAAVVYLMSSVPVPTAEAGVPPDMLQMMSLALKMMWPFDDEFSPSEDRMQNLVYAAGFIASEIERLIKAEGWQG